MTVTQSNKEPVTGNSDSESRGQIQGGGVMTALDDIAAERARQIGAYGYTPRHDDRHTGGELGLAAACYAAPSRMFKAENLAGRGNETFVAYKDAWPWADRFWKPKSRREDLVRAAALIVAEIERIDRDVAKAVVS